MKKGEIMIILILGGISVIASNQTQQFFGQEVIKQQGTSIQGITAYTEQEPLEILNDSAFALYDLDGSGDSDDPYQITGYNITDSIKDLIKIKDTTKYFRISNCYLNGLNGGNTLIYLFNVTHGTIVNNTIRNTVDGAAIYLDESDNNTILNNTVHDCRDDIWLDSSSNNTISDNTLHDCPNGINLRSSSNNNTLSGNTIYNIANEGIIIINSPKNTLLNNIIYECLREGIYLLESSNSTLSGNLVHDCDNGIYLLSPVIENIIVSNNIIYNCTGAGIYMDYAHNSTLAGNTIYNCQNEGIFLGGSNNNTLLNNFVYNCTSVGIGLDSSSNNNFSSNTIYNCSSHGIYLDNSNNNTIRYNNVYNNTNFGFYFADTADNTVNWNNFVDNKGNQTPQAYEGTITNNVSYNYWDDHTEPDTEEPYGIVDTPYVLAGVSDEDPSPLTTLVLPTVNILTPLAQKYGVEKITVRLAGRLSVRYQYYIEGVDSQNRTWTANEERTLADGSYTLHAYCSDILGNTVHISVMFTIDTTSPTITLTFPANATIHPSGTIIDVTVTDALLHTVLYHWEGNSNQTWSGKYQTMLPTGDTQHLLYVYANDSFNKWAFEVFIFTTDDIAPTITLNSPTNETSHPAETMINLTVIDIHLETVLYHWDDSTNQTLTAPYNVTLPTESGQHVLRVYAKDSAGHWAAKTFVFRTRQPVDLGSLIGMSAIGMSVAALVGGGYFFLKKKGLSFRDLLGREPREPPESYEPPED